MLITLVDASIATLRILCSRSVAGVVQSMDGAATKLMVIFREISVYGQDAVTVVIKTGTLQKTNWILFTKPSTEMLLTLGAMAFVIK